MPRRKPTQHNNRHENGVVAPGKRITKQKSNGHLNGSAEKDPSATGVPSPSPSVAHTTPLVPEKRINGHLPTPKGSKDDAIEQDNQLTELVADEIEGSLSNIKPANGTLNALTIKGDMNSPKGSSARKHNVFNLALTILRSCPLGDTLTILIILLSIPSTVLTLINTLFAMLTFMPPAGSFFSLPNTFNDIFQGSGGTPSLATIVITDILGLLIWLVAWNPLQALAIEYTQAVVAATLGGGNSNKKNGYDSTALCLAIVTFRHVTSRGYIPPQILGFDWPAILSKIPYLSARPPSFIAVPNFDFLMNDSKGGWGWFRILIALHILIQGLVHVARRWYQKREYFQSTPIAKKIDPEAGAGAPVRSSPNALGELMGTSNHSQSQSVSTKTSLAAVKETRDKMSSGKKKKKQATLVRSQQPLWAAFAATKVTIMREYDQTHSMADVSISDARDASDLGSAPLSDVDDRIWISEVHSDKFVFHTTCSTDIDHTNDNLKAEAAPGVDRSKPFYVRINDTDWTSTTIMRREGDKTAAGPWSGVVFGLTPSSSYRCSLVHSEDDTVVFSGIVTTSPSLVDEHGKRYLRKLNFLSANLGVLELPATTTETTYGNHLPYSPTSPTTTLKKSIAAFEASLNDSYVRQKRSKKDSKATSASIKKDIDVFHTKISKLAGEDRSHTNRHLQWNQHTRQADEAIAQLNIEIESLGSIPEEELKTSRDSKARWEDTKQQQAGTRDNLLRSKDATHRERISIQNEAHSALQKKERLLSRKLKLNDQCGKLESATAEGLNDKERKNSEQAAKDLQRLQLEHDLQDRVTNLNQTWNDSRYSIAHFMSQAQLLDNAFHEQQMLATTLTNADGRPLTPEGDLPGENPQNAAATAHRFPAFGTPESSGGLRSHSDSLRHTDSRPRSTSLLSGNSNYVDFEDQDPAPPMPSRAVEAIRGRGRKRSGASAGGSSGSNSQRDPASPVVGNRGAQDSPVGKPIWNQ